MRRIRHKTVTTRIRLLLLKYFLRPHTAFPEVNPPKQELDDVWKNIVLSSEHTWTANVSVREPENEESISQQAVKDNYAIQAKMELTDVSNTALGQLANQIHIPEQTLVVFNSLSWKRNAIVTTDLLPTEELVDMATKLPVPIHTVSNLQGFKRVRFVANGLPTVGYKCYAIRTRKEVAKQEAFSKEPVIGNQYYRIKIDAGSGAIQSIYDKQLQKELVDSNSSYKFGQYLYVTGGDGLTRIIKQTTAYPLAKLTIHPSSNGEYVGTEKTAWSRVIHLHSSNVNTPSIDAEISVFDNEKKIEFNYKVHKTYTTSKEAVYFAFPIAVAEPKFTYATQQRWVDPAHDLFKGSSLEWFPVQGWMAAFDSKMFVNIVPVDAPLASFGDINRGLWPGEFHPKTSTIFSYAMNNYWETNYTAGQGGDFTFRYVLTSADRLDPVGLARLSAESMQAPMVDHVVHQDKVDEPEGSLPAAGTGFLDVKSPNVVLVTWKLAQDGRGMILRLREVTGQETETQIAFPHSAIHSAMLASGVEDDLEKINVDNNSIALKFHPYEVLTVRLLP